MQRGELWNVIVVESEEHMERRLYQVTGGETVLTGGGQVQAERASQYPPREAVSHFSSLE